MSLFTESVSRRMSMGNPPRGQIAQALMRRAGPDASAAQVADACIETWHEIDAALAPIVGRGGVGALYKRSLHLTALAYPCLSGVAESVQPSLDAAALRSALSNQPRAEAADAGGAVLLTFHELLTQLIGAPLTEQLLRTVWARFLSGETAQDLPS